MLFMTKEEYLKVVREPSALQQEVLDVLEWLKIRLGLELNVLDLNET